MFAGAGVVGLAIGFGRDIGLDEPNLFAQLSRQRLPFVRLHIGNDRVGPIGDQHAHRALSQAGGAACDKKCSPLQLHDNLTFEMK